MIRMKKFLAAFVLICMIAFCAGCACASQNPVATPTPSPSPTPDAVQNEVMPQTSQTVNRGTYAFSRLQQTEDGTTTDVEENACILHYNADVFTLLAEESNPYGAVFSSQDSLGLDQITVRIAEPRDEFGMMADCFDYYELQLQDDAELDDMEDFDTRAGKVTYYTTTSDLEGDGQNVRVYYAINMGDVAFCGMMDLALDAEAMLLDENLLLDYAEDYFEENVGKQVFENLFLEVTRNDPAKEPDNVAQTTAQ